MNPLSDCVILIVDDVETNVDILVDALGKDYRICVALDGTSALRLVKESPPDLVLLDIMMPGMNGYDVCRRLKENAQTKDIPVIFLTAMVEIQNKAVGFELGAVDYITKPFDVLEVQARVKTHLSLVLARRQLEQQNEILEEKVKDRTMKLLLTQEVTIESMAALAEYRDPETGGHIKRTKNYVRALAERLKSHPAYRDELTEENIGLLWLSAPLHDIGKVGVPDQILLKPGKLTAQEFEEMKKHTIYGHNALQHAEQKLGQNSFLRSATEISYSHHEKWGGSGYPRGLKEEEIPLSGRLMAIADVYDALISKRVYKPPMPHKQAVQIILEGKGSHFDPTMVDVFMKLQEEFRQIALRFTDFEEEKQALSQK